MGTLFKAAIGFAIALTLLPGKPGWAPDFAPLKHDLAEARPGDRIEAWLAPQIGTPPRAQRLHLPSPGTGRGR